MYVYIYMYKSYIYMYKSYIIIYLYVYLYVQLVFYRYISIICIDGDTRCMEKIPPQKQWLSRELENIFGTIPWGCLI